MGRWLAVVVLLVSAASAAAPAADALPANPWTGQWDTGGKVVTLNQGGTSITGTAPADCTGNPTGQTINGNVTSADGSEAHFNYSGGSECPGEGGSFDAVMSSDGRTVTGHGVTQYGTGFSFTWTYVSGGTEPRTEEVTSNDAVRRLQGQLHRLGLYSGPLDGKDSDQLTAAVKKFQRRVGLRVDGDCDQRCRSALKKALGLDDPKRPPGAAPKAPRTVTELQRDLKKLGFYSGPLDGDLDARTKAAVKRFQHDAGIPVDGSCTARCQFAIVRALTKMATGSASWSLTASRMHAAEADRRTY